MEPLLNILTKRDQADIVKDQTKEIEENHITDRGENNDVLYLAYINSIIICSFFIFYGL
jgi:hypothetical protein